MTASRKQRRQGRLTTWLDDKGYGFIESDGGPAGDRTFVHIKDFSRRPRRPVQDDVLVYTLSIDDRGRPRAVNVEYAKAGRRSARRARGRYGALTVALGFLALVAGAAEVMGRPLLIPVFCFAMSIVTFIVYAFDKSAARRGGWRVSEGNLHLLSLAGGWPGALVAQRYLRHKSRKQPFRGVFLVTVVVNVVAVLWLLTSDIPLA